MPSVPQLMRQHPRHLMRDGRSGPDWAWRAVVPPHGRGVTLDEFKQALQDRLLNVVASRAAKHTVKVRAGLRPFACKRGSSIIHHSVAGLALLEGSLALGRIACGEMSDELPADDRGAFVLYHSPNVPGVVNGNSRTGFDAMLERLRAEALGPKGSLKVALDDEAFDPAGYLSASARTIAMEPDGRFSMPAEFAQALDAEAGVMLVGKGDKFQMWNPKRRQARRDRDRDTCSPETLAGAPELLLDPVVRNPIGMPFGVEEVGALAGGHRFHQEPQAERMVRSRRGRCRYHPARRHVQFGDARAAARHPQLP